MSRQPFDILNHHPTALPPARRGTKRVLAIRMLAAQNAWLNGPLYWAAGRVAWQTPAGLVIPTAADLALAQRRIYTIRRYPTAAKLALGDHNEWLAQQQARLKLAKRLQLLGVTDISALVRQTHQGVPTIVLQLIELLLVEALCLNRLPASPAEALVRCGQVAVAPLMPLIHDEQIPLNGRMLGAMILGALSRRQIDKGRSGQTVESIVRERMLRTAYTWGLHFGLTTPPALVAALLVDKSGWSLAERYRDIVRVTRYFTLPYEFMRELLARGMPPDQVVVLVAATARAEPLARRVLEHHDQLHNLWGARRYERSKRIQRTRHAFLQTIIELLRSYARATVDPAIIDAFVAYVTCILDLFPPSPELAEHLSLVLRKGLELPCACQSAYLELLVEWHLDLWNPEGFPQSKKPSVAGWFEQRWKEYVQPLWSLLNLTQDTQSVRTVLDLEVQNLFTTGKAATPDIYQFAIRLLREVHCPGRLSTSRQLWACLRLFPNVREARRLFLPFVHALSPVRCELRRYYVEIICTVLPQTRQGLRHGLPLLTRFLSKLIALQTTDEPDKFFCEAVAACAYILHTKAPEHADACLEWLLGFLHEWYKNKATPLPYGEAEMLKKGLLLISVLSQGDLAQFQMLVRLWTQHTFDYSGTMPKIGIERLSRYPWLCETLAQQFAQKPFRCVALVVRLGSTARLNSEDRTSLELLENIDPVKHGSSSGLLVAADHQWYELLELAPNLSTTVAHYLYAQWLCGGSFDLPAGVRHALDQPRKLARERDYLAQAVAQAPERTNLAIRLRNLRARLADRAGLDAAIRAEVSERLNQITAETRLAAAEQQVLACFRARLTSVCGPLPADLHFDDHLLNAALLTTDITENRPLLRQLLRAHLAQDTHWRERHLANAAFLEQLRVRGVAVDTWLSAYPQVYRCPGVTDERVRLQFEVDPVHILQMGNYFDTCLSLGGCNAFATVANACELNKRVIYATNSAGRVIGRQLIGMNEQWGIVGFHIYTSLSDNESNNALNSIFQRYVRSFAARCGLPLSDTGTVPILFAQDWYDDGIEPWTDDSEQEQVAHKRDGAVKSKTS